MSEAPWQEILTVVIGAIVGAIMRHYGYQAYWKAKGRPDRRKKR